MAHPLLTGLLVTLAFAVPAPASAADVAERVRGTAEMAREFWTQRDVTGCEVGFSVEVFNDPAAAAMEGGFCRIRVNLYWQAPNAWAISREVECSLVFHEVRHALPGGESGGVDGNGHTEDGLMARAPRVVPYECVQRPRSQRRVRVARWRVNPHPMKGVLR